MFKDIVVFPKRAIPSLDTPLPWAMISVSTVAGEWPEYDDKNCKAVLRMSFHDADPESMNPSPLTKPEDYFDDLQANKVLDFVESIENIGVNMLVVHCEAGISRSPAIAAAIANRYFHNDKEYFEPPYCPNMHVYRKLMNAVQERGWKEKCGD